jgi:TfoX/Sxy family transcriptional regulator of competence genes
MAYSEALAGRIRDALANVKGVSEKAMFGGIAFMRRGHMFVGTLGDELMVRVGKDAHDELVGLPHARIMDFTGKPMKGFLVIGTAGVKTPAAIRPWAARAVAHNDAQPVKKLAAAAKKAAGKKAAAKTTTARKPANKK